MRRKALRLLVRALGPALGLVIRFRLPWVLRRRMLTLSARKWLERYNPRETPPVLPGDAPVRVAVLVDARGATAQAVRRTLRSLAGASLAAPAIHFVAVHVVADQDAAETLANALADAASPGPPRIWSADKLDALLGLAAGSADRCLCVCLNALCGVEFDEDALGHLCAVLDAGPDMAFAYCDEIVRRDGKTEVFCKPAWDKVLFETLNYVGPAVLVPSGLLAAARGGDHGLCGLAEELVQFAATRAQGFVAHVPLPLLQVEAHGKAPYPQRREARHATDSPPPAPPVSVIIPTRDRADLLAACLRTLRHTVAAPQRLEIILVDNGSACPAAKALLQAEAVSGSIVLRDAGDFNYSRLVNLGARAATGRFLLLLNNDIEFGAPGWLEEMLGHALRPGTGCVGANLLYRNGMVQHAGVVLGVFSPMLDRHIAGHAHHGWSEASGGYFGLLSHARTVSAVTAALLLVSAETYQAVGGFNEVLAVALNDVDFCLKVGRQGLANIVVPVRGVIHLESASRSLDNTADKLERLGRENEMLQTDWGHAILDDPFYSPNLDLDLLSYSLSHRPRPRTPRIRPVG